MQALYHALRRAQQHLAADVPNLYDMKVYTDNTVICWPFRDDGESALGSITQQVALFQMSLA